jgi:hypothetical protein
MKLDAFLRRCSLQKVGSLAEPDFIRLLNEAAKRQKNQN